MGTVLLQVLNMKLLVCVALVLVCSELSHQFCAPPLIQRLTSGSSSQNCRQVPKEVCNQVPKTTYDSVTKKQCKDVQGNPAPIPRRGNVKSLRNLFRNKFKEENVPFRSRMNVPRLMTSPSNVPPCKRSNASMPRN